MPWLWCIVARVCLIPLRQACFQTKHTARSSQTPDHLPAHCHIWPKTQSVLVWWGEIWGVILVGKDVMVEAWDEHGCRFAALTKMRYFVISNISLFVPRSFFISIDFSLVSPPLTLPSHSSPLSHPSSLLLPPGASLSLTLFGEILKMAEWAWLPSLVWLLTLLFFSDRPCTS